MSEDSSNTADKPVSPAHRPAADERQGKRWPWRPMTAISIVVVIFVMSQVLAVVISSILGEILFRSNDATFTQFLTILIAELLVILGVYALFRMARIHFRELGFTRPQARDIWLAAAGFIIYFGLFVTLSTVLQWLVPGLDASQKQEIGFEDASGFVDLAFVFVALVVMAPLAEEVLFRGFLFGSMRRRMSFLAATLVTSLLFGAAHLLGGERGAALLWIAGIDTLILSTVLCYLREETGRLWSPFLLHAMKNGVAFTLIFVLKLN